MDYKMPELFEKFKVEYYTKPVYSEEAGNGRIYAYNPGKKEGLAKRYKTVLVYKSEEGYTMSLLEHGGPIISNKDYDECKKIFMEALKLCFAIMSLTSFDTSKAKLKEEWKIKRKEIRERNKKNKNDGK